MSDRIVFNYEFRFPVELWYIDYLLEEEIYLQGRVLIVKNTENKDWWIDEYYVRGWKEVDGSWVDEWVLVSPWTDDGWLRGAMARQLQRPEHRASIEDMIRKMSGADAVG